MRELEKWHHDHDNIHFAPACTVASHGGEFSASVQIWQSPGVKCWVHEGNLYMRHFSELLI